MIFYWIGVITIMYLTAKFTFALFDWLNIPNPILVVLGLDREGRE